MNNFVKPSGKDMAERELAWGPQKTMTIALPGAQIHWRPAATTRAVVRGHAQSIELVCLEEGHTSQEVRLGIAAGQKLKHPWFRSYEIVVELQSPAIEEWVLEGSAELYLHNVNQPFIHLEVQGSGDIQAGGEVEDVLITIVGSGEVDTAMLTQKNAKVRMTGHGDAIIMPTQSADLVTDRGDVKVLSQPREFASRKH